VSEATRKKLVYVTLPLAIIWAIYAYPTKKPQLPMEQPAPAAAQLAPAVPRMVAVSPSTRTINIEEKQKASWGADPFRTDVRRSPGRQTSNASDATWVLGGIVYSEINPMAFINSMSVGVGDTVADARVVEIGRQTVTLEHKGRQFTLSVYKG